MLERAFSTKVMKKLKAGPGLWRKNPVSRFGQAGVADIIGLVRGRYVEIELKAPGKYKDPLDGCSDLQIAHGKEVIDNGGIWICGDDWLCITAALLDAISS